MLARPAEQAYPRPYDTAPQHRSTYVAGHYLACAGASLIDGAGGG